jgi:hypothetical protein
MKLDTITFPNKKKGKIMQQKITSEQIQAILKEAEAGQSLPKAAPAKAINFNAAFYKKTVRPALLGAAGILRFLKPKWAEGIAAAVAFMDMTFQQESEV